jgi:hypothetical protein
MMAKKETKEKPISIHRKGPGYEVKYFISGPGAQSFHEKLEKVFDKLDEDGDE